MSWVVMVVVGGVAFLAGVLVTALGFGYIRAENEQLREGLRNVRGTAMRHPDLKRLVTYIDGLLGDEAGA